ncbi:MAG: cupredoxin domain-containing protein [Bacteroidota bacterium]
MKIKALSILFALVATVGLTSVSLAQDAKTVKLEQTPGKFEETQLKLKAGDYIFEVENNGVDHEVGFVLVEKGADASNPENHIQEAYLANTITDGQSAQSKVVSLDKGEYEFFCPLNPTPHYTIVVK